MAAAASASFRLGPALRGYATGASPAHLRHPLSFSLPPYPPTSAAPPLPLLAPLPAAVPAAAAPHQRYPPLPSPQPLSSTPSLSRPRRWPHQRHATSPRRGAGGGQPGRMAAAGGAALGRTALVAPLVLLYYGFSIGITFYNKWLMKSFPFPLLVTLLHLLLIFGLSALARALARYRSGRPRAALSWADCLRRAAPAALSTSLDIGLSNWSFLYVTVSLYTMTKSSAILFILLFSLLFKLEEVRMALLLVVLLIAGGLFMFTYKSTQFNAQGFVLVLCASFLGGIRWTLTQILMQKAELGLQNPIDTMFHLQPLMFLGLFPLFAVFEGA